MLRGVFFKLKKSSNNVLLDVLSCIDVQNYCWYNIESETQVWDNTHKDKLLKSNYYNGTALLEYITVEHFAMFGKLQAYLKDSNFKDINTYDDFKNSDCQIMLLIYDCDFVEIYAKDKRVIDSFYKRALELDCEEIEYITDENDRRIRMSF